MSPFDPHPSGPDDARALLLEACSDWRAERVHWPAFDEEDFRRRAIALAEHSHDPALADAVWDYREGTIDHRELRRHPAFVAAFDRDTAGVAEEWGDGRGAGVLLDALRTARAERPDLA